MTKQVRCGNVLIGGGAPISIQSMTNVEMKNTDAVHAQIRSLAAAGCNIVRVAVPHGAGAAGLHAGALAGGGHLRLLAAVPDSVGQFFGPAVPRLDHDRRLKPNTG